MSNTAALSAYAARRDMWLTRVVADLRTNNRFAAAWLAGSFGRKTNDAVSDPARAGAAARRCRYAPRESG
jgi:hypothetical protein